MTRVTEATAVHRRSVWHTISWVGLVVLGAFNLFAVAIDLAADASSGLPSDHTGTFGRLAGTSWAAFKAASHGAAQYMTTLERGYALHELVFAILFLAIVIIPYRARQWWAWWACWALLIGYLGYLLTFGVHDHTILARALVGVIALPVLLLLALPGFVSSRQVP
jgi:hypothetical protein